MTDTESAAARIEARGRELEMPPTLLNVESLAYRVFKVHSVATEPRAVRDKVRQGISGKSTLVVQEALGITGDRMAQLVHVSAKTLSTQRTKKKLGIAIGNRLVPLVRVFDRAVEVLGSPDKASQWLGESNVALGSETPRSWLDTDAGVQEVLNILGRIEHGVYS